MESGDRRYSPELVPNNYSSKRRRRRNTTKNNKSVTPITSGIAGTSSVQKTFKPISLAELCLSVINTTRVLIFQKLVQDKDNVQVTVENSHISMETFQEETEYDTGETVTLLEDSGKEPSLNTMIRQDLEQDSSQSIVLDFTFPCFTESPQNPTDHQEVINPSCSSNPDPLLGILASDEIDDALTNSDDGDFSPDDGDPDYEPYEAVSHSSREFDDLEVAENVTVSSSVEKRKRAKRGRADKESWIAEVNKMRRMKGEHYDGRRKTDEGKIVFDVRKRERCLKPRCNHTETSKYYQCWKVTDENRENYFNDYWKLSWQGKKVWVKQTVTCKNVSRRSTSVNNNARRNYTYNYTFKTPERPVNFCKNMYINTLNIGEWSVHNWLKLKADKTHKTKRNSVIQESEENGRKYIHEYLNSLPKLESHYCRKTTTKLYLEPNWNSKQSVYREYLHFLEDKGEEDSKVSNFVFWDEFEKMSLSLFSPKKDECDICCAKRVGNLSDENYTVHILRKDKARQEKSSDKNINDPSVKVFTFDLQAVLLSPALNASALYYKTKLKVHNFTIFDLNTSEGFCFIWNECEGGVTADEFASILYHFINNHVDETVKDVIFWSDGCTNQNRNAILANALLLVAVQKNITITHKFLEKGHTQMECDSMHATIERKLKNREIYSPAQYIEICKSARLTKPYNVKYLQHTFFLKFSSLPYLKSIRPGKKSGDDTVFDLRCLQYRTDGTIFFKKTISEDFRQIPQKVKMPGLTDTLPSLYNTQISIPKSKYVHLQELKSVLPLDVHSFYDLLPHQCNERRRNACSCRKEVIA